MSIYDFEKYYEISPLQYFKIHMPIDMNNQPIIILGAPAGSEDAVSKSSLPSIVPSIVKLSYIFGTVTRTKFKLGGREFYVNAFIFSGVPINFDSVNIRSIYLYNEGKYVNRNDTFHLNYEDLDHTK